MLVTNIKIYESGLNIYADVVYTNKTIETVQWNNVDNRKRVLENINSYTIFKDTRSKE